MGADLFLSMIDALFCKDGRKLMPSFRQLRYASPGCAQSGLLLHTAVACATAIPSTIPPSGFGYGRTNTRIHEGGGSSGGGRMRRGGHENRGRREQEQGGNGGGGLGRSMRESQVA